MSHTLSDCLRDPYVPSLVLLLNVLDCIAHHYRFKLSSLQVLVYLIAIKTIDSMCSRLQERSLGLLILYLIPFVKATALMCDLHELVIGELPE